MPVQLKTIHICGRTLSVKNYHCIDCGPDFSPAHGAAYFQKEHPLLRLYVHITDQCNAACPFCRRKGEFPCGGCVDPNQFRKALAAIAPYIYSVGFTGGEPMLFPELTDTLVGIADEVLGPDAEIDLVTNGTHLERIPFMKNSDRITTVHISRHAAADEQNQKLMGFSACRADVIRNVMNRLNDPGKIVLNCVLQKGGVDRTEAVADYLDFSADIGIKNNAFITMYQANSYCREHYISPDAISILAESSPAEWNSANPGRIFTVWNRHRDNDYCSCLTGSYESSSGRTRFYFRLPGSARPPKYCRQLVFTADNLLTEGFGGQILDYHAAL